MVIISYIYIEHLLWFLASSNLGAFSSFGKRYMQIRQKFFANGQCAVHTGQAFILGSSTGTSTFSSSLSLITTFGSSIFFSFSLSCLTSNLVAHPEQ